MASLLLLPLLYGALYLRSFWDPYGRFDRIPVALVNDDKGASVSGKQLAAGADIARGRGPGGRRHVDVVGDRRHVGRRLPDLDDAVRKVDELNEGAAQVAAGAKKLHTGLSTAKAGAVALDTGVGDLRAGADTLSGGMFKLVDRSLIPPLNLRPSPRVPRPGASRWRAGCRWPPWACSRRWP